MVQSLRQTIAVRLSASPQVNLGILSLRGDIGFDFPFALGDDPLQTTLSNGTTISVARDEPILFHANLGVAVKVPLVTISAELVNIGDISDAGDDRAIGDRFRHTFAVGLHVSLPFVKPYVAFVVPLDERFRGEEYVVTVGVNAAF